MAADIRRLILWRRVVWAFALILPTYWAFTYGGVYRTSSELQLQLTSAYMPLLSFAVSVIVVLIPAIYLTNRICAAETQGMSDAEAKAYRFQKREQKKKEGDEFEKWLNGHRALILFSTLLVLGSSLGGAFLWTAHRAGSLVSLQATQLHEMNEIPERYLAVQACYGASSAVEIKNNTRRGGTWEIYFPCLGTPGETAKLIIKATGKRDYQDIRSIPPRRLRLAGIVNSEIPDYVLAQLRSRGISVAERVWVMDEGSSPEAYRTEGKLLWAVMGSIGAVGLLATLLWQSFRRRRKN
ncbi:MAG: hypothetical protein HYS18_04535 [Burkholderiales bacterium]|nr:hypothetical protein [Burkholderiales bacterium]